MLKIAENLSLPVELVTETVAILAKRGSGKTYTASVLAEEMLAVGAHIVWIDPVGVAWGLRSNPDGSGEGFPLLILGGSRGDLPLDHTAGRAIAELIVGESLSCILDLSLLTMPQISEFLTAFLTELYRLKATSPAPLHIFLDEADMVAPQKSNSSGESATLVAMDTIVRRGRVRGLGVTMITQRPAVLSKNVLTQVEVLIAQRLTSPNDQKAIDEWVQAHGTQDERKRVAESLATLAVGEAWVWAPNLTGELQRVQIRRRHTFDSSSTPKVGESVRVPQSLHSIDLTALRERLATALHQALENDPDTLKRQIGDLKRQLTERPTETIIETVVERVEVPVLTPDAIAQLHLMLDSAAGTAKDLMAFHATIKALLDRMEKPSAVIPAVAKAPSVKAPSRPTPPKEDKPLTPPPSRVKLKESPQALLDALAEFEALGIRRVQRANIAVWAGISPNSGATNNHIKELMTSGMLTYPSPGFLSLTATGRQQAKAIQTPRNSSELLTMWTRRMPPGQAAILRALATAYPQSLTRSQLSQRTGLSDNSGSFNSAISELKNYGLVQYPKPGSVVATKLLFPGGK